MGAGERDTTPISSFFFLLWGVSHSGLIHAAHLSHLSSHLPSPRGPVVKDLRLPQSQTSKSPGKGKKSFNDTDAILNEAVLQFTLTRTLTYYKCVIRRTIRFITRRVSFAP